MTSWIPVIVAVITSGLSLIGVIMTNNASNKSIESKLAIAQAVTDTKLDNLADEVKKLNSFTMDIPAMKADIERLKDDIKRLERD